MLLKKPVPWADLGVTLLTVMGAMGVGHGLALLGTAPWLCWTAFGVILSARLAYGWVTTQRPNPAGPVPFPIRVPLDVVTMGTFFGGFLR